MRFVFLTMDGTHGAALRKAATALHQNYGLDIDLRFYTSTALRNAEDWQRLAQDVAEADMVFGARLFGEDYVRPLAEVLQQATCPVCIITSNPTLMHETRIGKFSLHPRSAGDSQQTSLFRQLLGKLRPKGGAEEIQRQMSFLRNLGKLLKHLPGKARDIHTYIAVHQYWLHCSPENLERMLCLLIERYVPNYQGHLPVQDAVLYPDVALLHPEAPEPFTRLGSYEKWQRQRQRQHRKQQPDAPVLDQGRVGLLSLRTVALSGNTAHLDALVYALEARGIEVCMAYSSGLDFRPAIERFYFGKGNQQASNGHNGNGQHSTIDMLINGTGFSLVGGPAESRPEEARAALEALDVSYMDVFPLSMQRIEEWQHNDAGLIPLHLTMNVAIPELDGAIDSLVIGGPTASNDSYAPLSQQIDLAAGRIARRVALHRKPNATKKLAIVLFNFPPTLGNVGTAAYLDVFGSLHKLLHELHAAGYEVEPPATQEALHKLLVEGNAMAYGTDGNVCARLPVRDYLRLFAGYRDIEPFWGKAPGELLNDGKHFYILGYQFGHVFVGIQPSFGYERDPMRLLMAKDAAPHHGFAAFYTWIEHVFGADAVLHLGTHGALEFMPGKQAGLSTECWPTRLLGDMPNVYYYSMNNPSEATIAKRRSAASLVSYLVPPLQQAGLYKGLRLLKDSLDNYRQHPTPDLLEDIQTQAARLGIGQEAAQGIASGDLSDPQAAEQYVAALAHELIQVEQRMIPAGLHILGTPPEISELVDMLALVAAFAQPDPALPPLPQVVANALGYDYAELRKRLKDSRTAQEQWERLDSICREAVRRFVGDDSQIMGNGQPGTGHTAAADSYVQQAAGVEPGTLAPLWQMLAELAHRITHDCEIEGLLHSLRGGYVSPAPGNDVVRNPAVVPTGRNIYGLDPHRIPSPVACQNGMLLVDELLTRLTAQQGSMPESIAMVLWGIDNLKSDGEGIAQVLALLGARAVADELGSISNVELIPLEELKRPRVDVVVTVSGIFRDLLHHQMRLLDKAVRLAAAADEPDELNFVRKHVLAQAAEMQVSPEAAATRIFANAPGSYGANVVNLVESSTWDDDQQLSEAFLNRKCYTCTADGNWQDARGIMERALSTVEATFQNIDSFEVGLSDIGHYYENLGGITKSVERLRGTRPGVLVADAVSTTERLSSLEQMVRLESRAKLLNPKWFEAMLKHGSEGVREIEARVSNTYGWSATTGAVEGWVYQGVAETFLLDAEMRQRMAQYNPHATAAMTRRLLEAQSRGYWQADEATLEALYQVYDNLEDQLEGV